MHSKWILFVMGIALFSGVFFAFSSQHHDRSRNDPKRVKRYLIKKLDVAPETAEKVVVAIKKMENARGQMELQRKAIRKKMESCFMAAEFDQNAISSMFDEELDDMRQHTSLLLNQLATVHSLLTAEQRIQLIYHVSNHQKGERRSHGKRN